MLQSNYNFDTDTKKIIIDVENEEQLMVETVLLLKELKTQLMFKQGREEGLNTYNAIIETSFN